GVLTTIISFLYRYLFVLTDEVVRMMRARQSRSAAAAGLRSGGSVTWRARTAGNMAGQLFLRSYERSDRIYNAMLSRGYRGELMTIHPHRFVRSDVLVGIFSILALIFMQIVGRL
ncbi:MAG: energy-coupling factor transporter transmembrane component T, partial [Syntrophothermus sp.]